MSTHPFGENPYSPPGPASYPEKTQVAPWVEKPSGPWQMNYFGAFEMIHRNPDWFVNTLLMFVCALIPVINGIVLTGYMYEVVEILHRTGGVYYPKFDFNRFVEYLLRGVGPFLIGLVFGTLLAVLVFVGYGVLIASAIAASSAGKENEAAAGLGVLSAFVVVFTLVFVGSLATNFIQQPLALRGGLSSEIGQSFNFGWAFDFIKKSWLEMILAFLFNFVVSLVCIVLMIVTCYTALIVVIGYLFLVNAWLQFQLYRVYLSRGGEPIPFKPAPLSLPM